MNNPYYKKFNLYQGCRCSPASSCRGFPPDRCRSRRSSGRSYCCGPTFSTVGAVGSRVIKRMRYARLDLREEREDDRNGRCGTRSWVLAIRGAYLGGGWPAGCACAGRFLFRRKKGWERGNFK